MAYFPGAFSLSLNSASRTDMYLINLGIKNLKDLRARQMEHGVHIIRIVMAHWTHPCTQGYQ